VGAAGVHALAQAALQGHVPHPRASGRAGRGTADLPAPDEALAEEIIRWAAAGLGRAEIPAEIQRRRSVSRNSDAMISDT
jgi:hypothetical protein